MKLFLPVGCKIKIGAHVHDAVVRPKFFLEVKIIDETTGVEYVRYVRGIPFALRIRLAIATRKLIATVRKHRKFMRKLR
jgi:hypothetical protein